VPVVISGGLRTAEAARRAYEQSGSAAVMIARGALGYPWVFEELTGRRADPPSTAEIVAEALWVIDRAEDHFGGERAARYLRKFYPWYLERLGADQLLAGALQRSDDLEVARRLVAELSARVPVAL
jgi:tRNA-dihydrouridine synthase B